MRFWILDFGFWIGTPVPRLTGAESLVLRGGRGSPVSRAPLRGRTDPDASSQPYDSPASVSITRSERLLRRRVVAPALLNPKSKFQNPKSIALCVLIILATFILHAAAQSTSARRTPGPWDARLERLRPQEPERYLELAEEVADAATNDTDRALARHLFALAGALEPERLGRSACLALADMEENAQAKRRLQALAALLPGPPSIGTLPATGGAGGAGGGAGMPTWSPSAALAVTEALSYYRRGDGQRALTALKAPGADALLQHFGRVLPGGYQRFIEDCKLYRGGGSGAGGQAPTLAFAGIVRMLRFESSILSGSDRSWSSELLLSSGGGGGAGEALIEVDPLSLQESLGIDASKPLYRAGRWVER
jgi:hypothetical protein